MKIIEIEIAFLENLIIRWNGRLGDEGSGDFNYGSG